MIIIFIVILLEFLFLYLLSRGIFLLLYTLFYLPAGALAKAGLPSKHQSISNHLVSFLFLPGTVIHEFSHAFVARLLGAKVGQIRVYPYKDEETGEFKAGSCEVQAVDPIRLSLIGLAPTLIGITILILSVGYLYDFNLPFNANARVRPSQPQQSTQQSMRGTDPSIIPNLDSSYKLLLFPIIFIISMTMFTSKKDITEFLMIAPFFALVFGLLYYVGFRVSLSENLVNFLKGPLYSLVFVMGFTLIIDLLIYIVLFVPVSLLLSLFRKQR